MVDLEFAPLPPTTLRQLVALLVGHLVPAVLQRVAGVTKVRHAPAQPLRNVATELALLLDLVRPVFVTLGLPQPLQLLAPRTHQFFLLELLPVVLTLLEPRVLGTLALVAYLVRHFLQAPFQHLHARLLELRSVPKMLNTEPLERKVLYLIIEVPNLCHQHLQFTLGFEFISAHLIAADTVQKRKLDSGSCPFGIDFKKKATLVHDVST